MRGILHADGTITDIHQLPPWPDPGDGELVEVEGPLPPPAPILRYDPATHRATAAEMPPDRLTMLEARVRALEGRR